VEWEPKGRFVVLVVKGVRRDLRICFGKRYGGEKAERKDRGEQFVVLEGVFDKV